MLDLLLFIIMIFWLILYFKMMKKILEEEKYDPFGRYQVKTQLKCTKCDLILIRAHREFEYIMQKKGNCPKCKAPMIIEGVYYEKKKTKKELQWEREIEKWR